MEHPDGRHVQRQQAIQMLREVIDGAPYAVVAARWSVSRSAVDRRVKALAAQLTRAVGVEGLHVNGTACVKRLRMNREAILHALDRFEPAAAPSRRCARVLTPEEVELGARRLRVRSTRRAHDLALYYLPFASGMRPLEIARLEVGDYLMEDGRVRRQSRVRPEIAINGRERPLFFGHRRLGEALEAYLDERVRDGHVAGPPDRWRGLDPRSPLFLAPDGKGYVVTPNGGAGETRAVCRPLLEVYRKIYRQADIPGLCTQSARLTLMSRMYERGADEDQVGLVLGIADRSAVRGQLPRPRPDLASVFEQLT